MATNNATDNKLGIPYTIGTTSLSNIPITQINQQIITASGTYTPTSGMVYCKVEVLASGGGGGGAAASASQTGGGSGGAGGGYSVSWISAATVGASQTVTIGSAGSGGASGTNNGTAGGNASFGSLVTATGGGGGVGSGSTATQAISAVTFGPAAGTGSIAVAGQNGLASLIVIGSVGVISTGMGGSSVYGIGGAATGIGTPGNATGFGAGGSGGVAFNGTNSAGGNGSKGAVIVTEYISS